MFKIRPYVTADSAAVVRLRNAVNPEPISEQEFQESDEQNAANPHVNWRRFVAEAESAGVVGYAIAGHWSWLHENQYSIYVTVDQEFRRRGVGTQLLAEAEQWALAQGATIAFSSYMRGDDDTSLDWVKRHEYYVDLERTESILDLKQWDGTRFTGQIEKVRSSGIRLVTYDDADSEDVLRAIYEIDTTTAPDIPAYEGHVPTWEAYKADFKAWSAPKVIALAYDGDKAVGVSMLALPRVEGAGAYTGFTGVLREYRGRGLALALKLLTIEGAVAGGAPHMRTNNDFANPSMLAVNAKLGYEMVAGPRRLKKKL